MTVLTIEEVDRWIADTRDTIRALEEMISEDTARLEELHVEVRVFEGVKKKIKSGRV